MKKAMTVITKQFEGQSFNNIIKCEITIQRMQINKNYSSMAEMKGIKLKENGSCY